MEGSFFSLPGNDHENPEQICADCGQIFQPRSVGDGAEELCDTCYDAQFQPLRVAKWQRIEKKRRAIHLPGPRRIRRANGSTF